MLPFRVRHAIEFEPGNRADIGGSRALAYRVRQIQRDEACNHPAGDGDRLISRLCGRCHRRVAHHSFTRGSRCHSLDQVPILLLLRFILCGHFLFVGDLSPIGDRPAENLYFDAASELVEARLGAARLDAKVGCCLGAAARLNDHRLGLRQQLLAAFPQLRLHQVTTIDPPNRAVRGADLDVVVPAGEHVHALSIIENANLLVHLRHAAQKRKRALTHISGAERFVLGSEIPSQQRHHAQQRHCNQELALHLSSISEGGSRGTSRVNDFAARVNALHFLECLVKRYPIHCQFSGTPCAQLPAWQTARSKTSAAGARVAARRRTDAGRAQGQETCGIPPSV